MQTNRVCRQQFYEVFPGPCGNILYIMCLCLTQSLNSLGVKVVQFCGRLLWYGRANVLIAYEPQLRYCWVDCGHKSNYYLTYKPVFSTLPPTWMYALDVNSKEVNYLIGLKTYKFYHDCSIWKRNIHMLQANLRCFLLEHEPVNFFLFIYVY